MPLSPIPILFANILMPLIAMAFAQAIPTGMRPQDLYQRIVTWADELKVDDSLLEVIPRATPRRRRLIMSITKAGS